MDAPSCPRGTGGWALAGLALAGCVGGATTELAPEGPPEILQVITIERHRMSNGSTVNRPVIAYGRHPDATEDEQHPITTAPVTGQRVQVIVDELLLGRTLEELQCAALVDEDDFARLPAGVTADDLARCSGSPEQLAATCVGERAVCLRSDGTPVGILDRFDGNGQARPDGVPDVLRLIEGAAALRCGSGELWRDIPADPLNSFWQPSGNQQRLDDLDDGFRGFFLLGPSVVVIPRAPLPVASRCYPVFGEEVVDKSGIRPCAGIPCTPGDTSPAAFETEPLTALTLTPADGSTGVPRNLEIVLTTSAPLAAAPTISVAPPTAFSVVFTPSMPTRVTLRSMAMLSPQTRFTFSVTLRDTYGLGPATPLTFSLTTGGSPTL